ncbi:hypothetical protein D9757_000233 [Collybiopsis confluens]|uniref:Translational machinery component n=1 Tax=Collybiopsis confluens TaxID=2823264 RepID=A0A8H5MGY1_9AGAR|nr:hypothetical protein D9757_000233 [Collybiopsis confluens]
MLSSLRAPVQQTLKRVGGYAGYSTQQHFAAQSKFLVGLDGAPPTAEGGYTLPPPSLGPNKTAPTLAPLDSLPSGMSHHKLHCHSTRNNTITTFTDPNGMPIAWFSGGSCGFKKGQRASYEAGYQCAVRMFRRIEQTAAQKGSISLALYFKGFGQGREAMQKALLTSEGVNVKGLIHIVGDRTQIKIGGTRSKKRRRL